MQKRIDTIRRIVAEVFGVEESLLGDPGRPTDSLHAAAGHACMWLFKRHTDCTLFEAARWSGRTNHSIASDAWYRFNNGCVPGDPYHELAKTAEQKVEEALSCDSSS